MFAAAAEEPLREGHHRLSFNTARFLRRVLALATVDDAPH